MPPTSFVISQVSRNDSPIAVPTGRSSNAGRKPIRKAPSVSSNGRTGPSTTSRPPRSTVTRTGLPSDSTMSSNIFDALTVVPLIATIRSPGRRPICAAGVGRPGPDLALHLVDRRRRPAGAEDEQQREHEDGEDQIDARPGADHCDSLPRALAPVRVRAAVRDLVGPALHPLPRRRREVGVIRRAFERLERACSSVEVGVGQQALETLGRPDQLGRLMERPAEVRVDVGRRRPVHPRDLHVAPERDRADPVLDPVPPRPSRSPAGTR